MREIRWGIWGAGSIAQRVAGDLRLVKGAALHAVASRSAQRAEQFRAQFGAPRAHEGLDALLGDPEIDAVYIATPNQCHAGDSIRAIEAGKATLCEKPFALSLEEAERVADAARRNNVFCMEAMWTRFLPAVRKARQLVTEGAIGQVRLIQGNFAHAVVVTPQSRLFDPSAGGGALYDLGVYPISLAQHLLGVPQSISGSAIVGNTKVDELSAYQLIFAGGAVAQLWAGLRTTGTDEMILYGERGTLRICAPFYCAHRLVLTQFSPASAGTSAGNAALDIKTALALRFPSLRMVQRRVSALKKTLRPGRVLNYPFPGSGYQFEIEEVCRCLREGQTESEIMPLRDTLDVMRTMDALREQWSSTRRETTVPPCQPAITN